MEKSHTLFKNSVGSSSHSRKTTKIDKFDSPSRQSAENIPSSEEIEESANSGDVPRPTKSFFCLATMRDMTSEQMAEVDALEEEIQPQIPFYITAMHKASVVDESLAFSTAYAKEYLPQQDQTIRLQLLGKKNITWETEFQIKNRIQRRTHWLVRGWIQFAHDNKLEIGYICLFQLKKDEEEVTMMVHIIRKEQDVSSEKMRTE